MRLMVSALAVVLLSAGAASAEVLKIVWSGEIVAGQDVHGTFFGGGRVCEGIACTGGSGGRDLYGEALAITLLYDLDRGHTGSGDLSPILRAWATIAGHTEELVPLDFSQVVQTPLVEAGTSSIGMRGEGFRTDALYNYSQSFDLGGDLLPTLESIALPGLVLDPSRVTDPDDYAYGSLFLSREYRPIEFRADLVSASFRLNKAQVTAVPEPATWALMICGFGLAGAALRRRTLQA